MPAKIFHAAGKQLWPDQARPGQASRLHLKLPKVRLHNGASQASRYANFAAANAATGLCHHRCCYTDCWCIHLFPKLFGNNKNRITINYITKIFTNWQRAQRGQWKKERDKRKVKRGGKNWIYNFNGQTRKKTSQGQKKLWNHRVVTQKKTTKKINKKQKRGLLCRTRVGASRTTFGNECERKCIRHLQTVAHEVDDHWGYCWW